MPEADDRASAGTEFPFCHLEIATRDREGRVGDDGGLPLLLRERVDRNTRIPGELLKGKAAEFRTLNALLRLCRRKGAI